MSLHRFISLLLLCSLWQFSHAQPPVFDEQVFRSMSPTERYRLVHDSPFWKIRDSNQLAALLEQMTDIAEAKKDRHTLLALKYYTCLVSGNEGFKIPEGKTTAVLLNEIETEARKYGYKVEEVVAHYYLANDLAASQKMTYEQQYVEVQKTFDRMEAIGFEKFRDYSVESILLSLSQFLWQLEDFEKAFQYLTVAERFIQPTQEGGHHYTQILSYLQTYWKQKKDYDKSIEYIQKILQFHQNFQADNLESRWWNRFWQGFASIEMAALLIEQGKIAEGERYADQGYEMSKVKTHSTLLFPYQAEYDALMVLIPVKLKLGKLDEANSLLQRSQTIKELLEPQGQLDYFKPLQLYQHFSKYYEMRGNAVAALRYTRLAQVLHDSFNRRNDASKLAQIQRRLDAEKYAEKLQLVENEKHLQTLLCNAIFAILVLVVVLAFGNHRRLQHLRHLKETELENTKIKLDAMTQSFREKSNLAGSLRLEIEKLSNLVERTEYLEQLTKATILTKEDWTKFQAVFEKVHPNFIAQYKAHFPDLTPAETRLLVLEKLGLSPQEMANMLGVNKNTIHQTKLRLRRKMEEGQG